MHGPPDHKQGSCAAQPTKKPVSQLEVKLHVGTFLLSASILRSKNHIAHTDATASKAPSVQIELIEGNKYYILLPEEMACLWSLYCIV